MTTSLPLDRFIQSYDSKVKKLHDIGDAMDPLNIADQHAFTDAAAELSMSSTAVGAAMSARHGLLKKIINEIH